MPVSTKIFISADPSDKANALQLQQTLSAIDPGLTLEFWNRQPVVDTEYRATARAFIESARLFIIVHSPEYQNFPDTRWEMELALQEKMRRPMGLMLVIVQGRHAVIPAPLRGFAVLPAEDEAIEGTLTDKQMVRCGRFIIEMLSSTPATDDHIHDGRHIPLTLPDLQERLVEMSNRHNLLDVLSLLYELVFEEKMARLVRQLQDDFLGADLKYGVQLLEYQRSVEQIKTEIRNLIDGLNEEKLLKNNWRILFLERYRKGVPHPSTAFFFPNDEIKIPDTLNLPTTPNGSEEHTGFLSREQKLEFKRLLLLCQDALQVEKYAAAHHYCEQVRTTIDPQSAQLYEYLLVSFVKKEQPETIVRRLLDGIPGGFNHVKLYSDRFNQYQHHQPPQCPSETGEYNQEVGVEELAAALHQVYSSIEHNAICDTGDFVNEHQQVILKCIEAFSKIYHSLSPTTIFLDTLLIELMGGGKFNWIERMLVNDQDDLVFIGNSSFDLKGKTDELLLMLENADVQRVAPKQREMIREDLFWNLLNQCERLSEKVREEQRNHHQRTDLRRSVIRIIQACVAGHYLLTRPGDVLEAEKSLLRLAIELLIPDLLPDRGRFDLPESLRLDWFTLDDNGQLVLVNTALAYRDFEALVMLQKIISDHAGVQNWPMIAQNMHQVVWMRYVQDTEITYETVKTALQFTDFRRMDALEARKLLITCNRRRWIAHLAKPNSEIPFPDQIIDELAGNDQLLWLSLDSNGIRNHSDCTFFKYDAKTEIYRLLPNSQRWTEESLTASVVGNLYQKQVLPAYSALKAGIEADRPKAARLLEAMMMAFKSHSVPLYLDTVYQEITQETKFKWLEIDKYGHLFNFSTDFDALSAIKQLTDLLPQRYPAFDTNRTIADRRWSDQVNRYENEVSVLRYENRLSERRIVADIIWRLKGVYLFFNDRKYLEIPMQELQDRGRIRWFHRELGIFKTNGNHFENLKIGFDLKAERIEIRMYWDKMADF